MGIGSDAIELLAELRLAGLIRRKTAVIEIGAQQLGDTFLAAPDRVRRLGMLFGIKRPLPLPAANPTEIVHGSLRHLDAGAPPARDFWTWLGFDYAAIDIDGSPDSIPLDLNCDAVPPGSEGAYGLVTNFGTTEHVANQLNAFKIIHDLTALNGLMIHELPAQGMFNHGLVNYNMKFFWMLARSNIYKFVFADYRQADHYDLPENIVDFVASLNPGAWERRPRYQGADAGLLIVLQKTYDIPFVPPLDVPTGTPTDIKALKQRYWTVFDPTAVERLVTYGASPTPHDGTRDTGEHVRCETGPASTSADRAEA